LGSKETAGVDIFRFDGEGKIVEHWDVLQPVPASSNNRNKMLPLRRNGTKAATGGVSFGSAMLKASSLS
jgi:hypothetical protein